MSNTGWTTRGNKPNCKQLIVHLRTILNIPPVYIDLHQALLILHLSTLHTTIISKSQLAIGGSAWRPTRCLVHPDMRINILYGLLCIRRLYRIQRFSSWKCVVKNWRCFLFEVVCTWHNGPSGCFMVGFDSPDVVDRFCSNIFTRYWVDFVHLAGRACAALLISIALGMHCL